MIDYLLTDEQKMIRDLCSQITEEKITPIAGELDKTEEFPWEVMKVIAQSDLFGLYIEEKYGGMGGGVLDLCIATEEFSKDPVDIIDSILQDWLSDQGYI